MLISTSFDLRSGVQTPMRWEDPEGSDCVAISMSIPKRCREWSYESLGNGDKRDVRTAVLSLLSARAPRAAEPVPDEGREALRSVHTSCAPGHPTASSRKESYTSLTVQRAQPVSEPNATTSDPAYSVRLAGRDWEDTISFHPWRCASHLQDDALHLGGLKSPGPQHHCSSPSLSAESSRGLRAAPCLREQCGACESQLLGDPVSGSAKSSRFFWQSPPWKGGVNTHQHLCSLTKSDWLSHASGQWRIPRGRTLPLYPWVRAHRAAPGPASFVRK